MSGYDYNAAPLLSQQQAGYQQQAPGAYGGGYAQPPAQAGYPQGGYAQQPQYGQAPYGQVYAQQQPVYAPQVALVVQGGREVGDLTQAILGAFVGLVVGTCSFCAYFCSGPSHNLLMGINFGVGIGHVIIGIVLFIFANDHRYPGTNNWYFTKSGYNTVVAIGAVLVCLGIIFMLLGVLKLASISKFRRTCIQNNGGALPLRFELMRY